MHSIYNSFFVFFVARTSITITMIVICKSARICGNKQRSIHCAARAARRAPSSRVGGTRCKSHAGNTSTAAGTASRPHSPLLVFAQCTVACCFIECRNRVTLPDSQLPFSVLTRVVRAVQILDARLRLFIRKETNSCTAGRKFNLSKRVIWQ